RGTTSTGRCSPATGSSGSPPAFRLSGSSASSRPGSARGITGTRRAKPRRDPAACGSLNVDACEVFHKPRRRWGRGGGRVIAEHTIDTDVLVVGAGPGGSATAYHLRSEERRVGKGCSLWI